MTYKQLKWLILLIPTITVGLWEYVRHEYLLPYISMDVGNWLTPVIVLFVTFTLLTRFFNKLESMQEELKNERAEKAVLQERERIARDLHDGMAQSLFLLSVKVKQLEKLRVHEEDRQTLASLNDRIAEIHHYVRSGIEHVRKPLSQTCTWLESIKKEINTFKEETGIEVHTTIDINELYLTEDEKIELGSCVKEALINIQKHAQATDVFIDMLIHSDHRFVTIKDNGIGFEKGQELQRNHFGIQMMHESCNRVNWRLQIERNQGLTVLHFSPNDLDDRGRNGNE